jgi:pimeloyl-ACP methyl ester carboxylesterase
MLQNFAGLALCGLSPVRAHATILDVQAPKGRKVQISQFLPSQASKASIAFFHGNFSSPEKYRRLIDPWVAAGFAVFAPLHVDSTDHPDHAAYDRAGIWRARVEDAALVADLAATHGGGRFISAGHSYGALAALTLAGVTAQKPDGWTASLEDKRVSVVAAFSPPGLFPGLVDKAGFAALDTPALVQTGTKDVLPGFIDDYHAHLAAFELAKTSPRYALVLDGVDHYFGGGICRPELPGPVQQLGLDAAITISLDLFQAFALKDMAALGRLDAQIGSGAMGELTKA